MDIPDFDEHLIDGDVLRYNLGWSCEYSMFSAFDPETGDVNEFRGIKALRDWCKAQEKDIDTLDVAEEKILEPWSTCKRKLKAKLKYIRRQCGGDQVIYLSGKDNFRIKLAVTKPYKENRKDKPKPKHYQAISDFLIKNGAIVIDGMEADDALAMHSTMSPSAVICTIDKDLLQVEGWHFNLNSSDFQFVTVDEGEHLLYIQI